MPISFSWDSRKRRILLKWGVLFSLGWENGGPVKKILGLPIRFRTKRKILHPRRWVDIKRALSLLKMCRIKRVEGTVSLPDPMINGVLYGWTSAFRAMRPDSPVDGTVNFSGENWFSGEAVFSLKRLCTRILNRIFSRGAHWTGSMFSRLRKKRGKF